MRSRTHGLISRDHGTPEPRRRTTRRPRECAPRVGGTGARRSRRPRRWHAAWRCWREADFKRLLDPRDIERVCGRGRPGSRIVRDLAESLPIVHTAETQAQTLAESLLIEQLLVRGAPRPASNQPLCVDGTWYYPTSGSAVGARSSRSTGRCIAIRVVNATTVCAINTCGSMASLCGASSATSCWRIHQPRLLTRGRGYPSYRSRTTTDRAAGSGLRNDRWPTETRPRTCGAMDRRRFWVAKRPLTDRNTTQNRRAAPPTPERRVPRPGGRGTRVSIGQRRLRASASSAPARRQRQLSA